MSKPASLGWPGPLLRLKSIDSTQDLAKRLAENGGTDRTLIIAERQTKGRGRLRRRWTSDPGGLYLSILFRPQVSPRRLAELSLAFAGAAAKAAARISGLVTTVKPPNDVLARPRAGERHWKKVCGILIEASGSEQTDWVVVGLGLNVNNRVPARLGHASSLRQLAGRSFDLAKTERAFAAAIDSTYQAFLGK